jgi:hypothetical protein
VHSEKDRIEAKLDDVLSDLRDEERLREKAEDDAAARFEEAEKKYRGIIDDKEDVSADLPSPQRSADAASRTLPRSSRISPRRRQRCRLASRTWSVCRTRCATRSPRAAGSARATLTSTSRSSSRLSASSATSRAARQTWSGHARTSTGKTRRCASARTVWPAWCVSAARQLATS